MADTPWAIPTPYNPNPSGYKNNPFIQPGSQTQPVAANAVPVQSLSGGGIKFDTGTEVPSANVVGSLWQDVPNNVQAKNLGALPVNAPSPTPAPTPTPVKNDNADLIAKYQQGGWTDMNAILADIAAGGGSKFNGGGGSGSDVSDSDVNWIFQDLDNQLGQLGNWKSNQEAAVTNAGQGQYTAAQENYDTNKSRLEANRATEDMRAKQSLRDLAQNTTDLFDKLALQFGGGSALRDVLSAATRSVNQSRGNLMNTRNQGYQAIDAKVADLDKVYSTQKDKIKQWVDGKIIDVGNAINQLQYDIAGQKSNVRSQMKQQAIDSARNYLNTIAAQKATFEQQLDYWKRMREADLSEDLKGATQGAQYDPHTYSDKSGIQLSTGNVFAPNKDNSADIATAQYNTTGTTKKKNEDELGFTPTSSLPSYFK